jgi:hypothetical protein
MRLAEQWNAIEQRLDPRWSDARLELAIEDGMQRSRALALLAPAGPGGVGGRTIRFFATRGGTGVGPEAVRNLLRRLDEEDISGALECVSSTEAPAAEHVARTSLAADWDVALALLPEDWSDLLCELELTSSDYIEPAALLLAPLNPIQVDDRPTGFQFRAAHTFGYGASAGMVRRCLGRLDDAGIPGAVRVLRALSDSHPVATQGPVWYIGGKAV